MLTSFQTYILSFSMILMDVAASPLSANPDIHIKVAIDYVLKRKDYGRLFVRRQMLLLHELFSYLCLMDLVFQQMILYAITAIILGITFAWFNVDSILNM